MSAPAPAHRLLAQEASALLTRLDNVRPFALQMTAVPAACVSVQAQAAIEAQLERARKSLRAMVVGFLNWLGSEAGRRAPAEQAQRRFTILRLRFHGLLSQLDIFADVLVQRSEHDYGVWIAGLDVVAADALALPGYYESPPVICFLDRGHGAAIRRARTRLPGGGENPVAIIRIPRERMVGSGIASSLVHEVGHQASVLLRLVESMQAAMQAAIHSGRFPFARAILTRCLSEILADFWSVARLGIVSTLGLMGVVSLPRAFVFRIQPQDPHPFPWIRVKLSCAMGRALFPHSQWDQLEAIWDSYYPVEGLDEERREVIAQLQNALPAFVELLVHHRPPTLLGRSLAEALDTDQRQPARLEQLFESCRRAPRRMRSIAPSLAFAVIGQARWAAQLSPAGETEILTGLLKHWAVQDALGTSAICSQSRQRSVRSPEIPTLLAA